MIKTRRRDRKGTQQKEIDEGRWGNHDKTGGKETEDEREATKQRMERRERMTKEVSKARTKGKVQARLRHRRDKQLKG